MFRSVLGPNPRGVGRGSEGEGGGGELIFFLGFEGHFELPMTFWAFQIHTNLGGTRPFYHAENEGKWGGGGRMGANICAPVPRGHEGFPNAAGSQVGGSSLVTVGVCVGGGGGITSGFELSSPDHMPDSISLTSRSTARGGVGVGLGHGSHRRRVPTASVSFPHQHDWALPRLSGLTERGGGGLYIALDPRPRGSSSRRMAQHAPLHEQKALQRHIPRGCRTDPERGAEAPEKPPKLWGHRTHARTRAHGHALAQVRRSRRTHTHITARAHARTRSVAQPQSRPPSRTQP